jgi:hypothetical protein
VYILEASDGGGENREPRDVVGTRLEEPSCSTQKEKSSDGLVSLGTGAARGTNGIG